MIIRRVELENFISHKQSLIDFDTGITVIVGPNGAGKTSIIDAITYGLFREHTRGNRIEDLVNWDHSRARVRVWFLVNGVEYLVERTIVRVDNGSTRTEALLKEKTGDEWIVLARGDQLVDEEIEKLLGVSKKTYMLTVFVRQGEIERFITMPPRERRRVLAELLGLTRMEKAYERMKDVINEWNSIYITVSHEASRVKYLEGELRRVRERKKYLEERLRELKVAELKTLEALKRLQEKLSELEEKRDKVRELNNKARILRRDIEWFRKEKERLEKEVKDALEAANKLKNLEARYRKLLVVEDGVEALRRLRNLGDAKNRIEEERRKLEKIMEKLTEIEEKTRAYLELSASVKALEESLKIFRKRLLELNTLRTRLEEKEKQLERLRRRIEKVSSKYELSGQLVEKLVEKLRRSLRELENRRNVIIEIYNNIEAEIKVKRYQLNEVIRKIENIKSIRGDRCPLCGQPLTASLRQKLVNEYEEEKKRLEKRIVELEEEKNNVKKLLDKVNVEIEKIQRDYTDLLRITSELRELEHIVKALKEKKKLLEEECREYEEVEKRYEEAKRKLEELKTYYHEKIRLETERRRLEEKLRELNEKLEEAERLEEIIKNVEEKLGQPRSVFDKLREELYTLRIELVKLREKALKLRERRDEYNRVVRNLYEREKNLRVIEEKLRELDYSDEEYSRIRELVEKLRERLASIRKEIAGIEGSLRELSDIIDRREKELEKSKKTLKEKERIEKYLRLLNKIKTLFGENGLQKTIRIQAKNLVEHYLKEILQRFNLEFNDVSLDEDFNIIATTPRGRQPVETMSAGERVVLAIAFRLALAKALMGSGVESMILDEPTIHLDEERRRELARILKTGLEKTRQILPQLIVATYSRELEEAADTVYIVSRGEGYSKVSRIG